jgi:YggT family protein
MNQSAPDEPPPPQRGLTRAERGRDISDAQAQTEADTSKVGRYLRLLHPTLLLSMAEGYPVVLKQFIQFCLIIIWPAWAFTVLVAAAAHLLFYVTIYPILWVLFWPVRNHQKKHHPEEYAASQRK